MFVLLLLDDQGFLKVKFAQREESGKIHHCYKKQAQLEPTFSISTVFHGQKKGNVYGDFTFSTSKLPMGIDSSSVSPTNNPLNISLKKLHLEAYCKVKLVEAGKDAFRCRIKQIHHKKSQPGRTTLLSLGDSRIQKLPDSTTSPMQHILNYL